MLPNLTSIEQSKYMQICTQTFDESQIAAYCQADTTFELLAECEHMYPASDATIGRFISYSYDDVIYEVYTCKNAHITYPLATCIYNGWYMNTRVERISLHLPCVTEINGGLLFNCANLLEVHLSCPIVVDVGPSLVGNCKNLKIAVFVAPQLTSVISGWLSNCNSLRSLKIDAPRLKSVGDYWCSGCVSVVEVNVKTAILNTTSAKEYHAFRKTFV